MSEMFDLRNFDILKHIMIENNTASEKEFNEIDKRNKEMLRKSQAMNKQIDDGIAENLRLLGGLKKVF